MIEVVVTENMQEWAKSIIPEYTRRLAQGWSPAAAVTIAKPYATVTLTEEERQKVNLLLRADKLEDIITPE